MSLSKALLMTIFAGVLPALSGCWSGLSYLGDPPPVPEVPVATVVNAIKCEINDFFYERKPQHEGLAFRLKIDKAALASIKLKLHVARGGGLAFSQINVTGTPLQALVSVKPSATPFSFGASASSAMEVEVSLTMEQSASRALDCRGRKLARTNELKLKDWLTKLMDQGQNQIIADGPATHLSEIVLTTDFEVGATVGASPAIAIIPVLVPPTLSASVNSVHRLEIKLKGDTGKPDPSPAAKAPANGGGHAPGSVKN